MSTSRRPALLGPSKKINSWVRPGVCEVRASALRPVSALMRLDLPTLERPANATSKLAIGGRVSIDGEAQTNFHSPAKSFRPSSISFASVLSVMRSCLGSSRRLCEERSDEAIQFSCGEMDCFASLAMTEPLRAICWSGLLDGLLGKRRLEIVEQLNLHAVLAHDEALLQHRQQIVPGPVDH